MPYPYTPNLFMQTGGYLEGIPLRALSTSVLTPSVSATMGGEVSVVDDLVYSRCF